MTVRQDVPPLDLPAARRKREDEQAEEATRRAKAKATKAGPQQQAPDPRSFYWTLDDIVRLAPPEWLVEGLIARGAKVLVFGESGSYKSILAVDMLCRAAHGMAYHGLRTVAAPLVYVANEDAYGLAQHHVLGWHRYFGKPAGRVIVIPGNVKLDQTDDVQKILAAAAHAFPGERPLFVIDTWDRSLNGDQNQTADVNPGLNGLDRLLAAGEATVTNSHSPWSDKNRTKGSVTFWANHDTRLKAEKDETTKHGTLTVKHHKHAKDGFVVGFDFETYQFEGTAGAHVTTLIPQRIHDPQASPKPKQQTPIGKNQKLVFDAATKLLATADRRAPPHHPANGHAVVALETVREETRRLMASDPKHFASTFNSALNSLTGNGRLALYDGLVWLP